MSSRSSRPPIQEGPDCITCGNQGEIWKPVIGLWHILEGPPQMERVPCPACRPVTGMKWINDRTAILGWRQVPDDAPPVSPGAVGR